MMRLTALTNVASIAKWRTDCQLVIAFAIGTAECVWRGWFWAPKGHLNCPKNAAHWALFGQLCSWKHQPHCGRFKDQHGSLHQHCGIDHFVAVQMFESLQVTKIEEARLDDNKISIKCYLIAMHFLKVCGVEGRWEPIFDLSPNTMRDWAWCYAQKIQNLKHKKIAWPNNFFADDVWIVSVDPTDCPVKEKMHNTLSQDSYLFSFKLNGQAWDMCMQSTSLAAKSSGWMVNFCLRLQLVRRPLTHAHGQRPYATVV